MADDLGDEARPGPSRPTGWRQTLARAAGLAVLACVLALPLASQLIFSDWDTVPIDGFAGTTTYRLIGQGPITETFELTTLAGYNPGAGNQYQVHFSSPLSATYVLTSTTFEPLDTTPAITVTADLGAAAGGCCAAPHALCKNDGTCVTTFTGSDGRFRELIFQPGSASTVQIATDSLLSATVERWAGGLVATSSDVAAQTVRIYVQADGSSTWVPVNSVDCNPPTQNFHWATVTEPDDDFVAVACRDGSTMHVYQVALPSGTIQWDITPGTVPTPTAFRYAQLDSCGGQVPFPNQTSGPGIAMVAPRNTDMLVTLFGPVGNASPPGFQGSAVISGTTDDYFGMTCDDDLVTIARKDSDGSGLQTVILDFDGLSGAPNVYAETIDARTPDWINTAP
ncbi:MAG: hypothetical protein R2991_17055, partial [Thermoanaerobaculia bacterium]